MATFVSLPLIYAGCFSVLTAVVSSGCSISASASRASEATAVGGAFRHPISSAPRAGDGATVDPRQGFYGSRIEPPLPISKVMASVAGSTLYSREVNRSLCAATDRRTQKTWLGNALGLKLVDARAGMVLHYGEQDGLPAGRVVAVGADDTGAAWCIVESRIPPPTAPPSEGDRTLGATGFRFCAFEPNCGTWTVLRTVTPTSNPYNSSGTYYDGSYQSGDNREVLAQAGRPQVAVDSDRVTFTVGIAGASDDAAAYQLDRKTRIVRTVAWDEGLRADNRLLFATFVVSDPVKGGVWLGSNAGLLFRPTSSNDPDAPWSRQLADQVIVEGTAAATRGGVWVVTAPRQNNDRQYRPSGSGARSAWKLFRVGGTGHSDVTEETPPLPAPNTSNGRTINGRSFPGPVSNVSLPVAVIVEDDGAVWLTQRSMAAQSMGYPQSGFEAWWRRDAGAPAWTRYEMRSQNDPTFSMGVPPTLYETLPSGETHGNVSMTQLSDAAVRPLTLALLRTDGGRQEETRVAYWLRRRFPSWICPDDVAEKLGDGVVDPLRRTSTAYGIFDDPYGAAGMGWLMDKQGTTLLHMQRSAIPEDLLRARTLGYYQSSASDAAVTDPKIEKYPIPVGQTVKVRPNIDAMVSAGKNLYLAIQSRDLVAFNPAEGKFTPIPLRISGIYPSRYNPPVGVSDGGVIVSTPNSSESQVLKFQTADGGFRVLATPPNGSRVFGIAPNGGFFILTRDKRILFQLKEVATPIPLPAESPITGNVTPPGVAATDYIVWYYKDDGSVAGYDIERQRAVPTLSMRRQNGYGNQYLRIVGDGHGGAFIASENEAASVYHYDRERNVWEAATPPLLPVTAEPKDSFIHLPPVIVSGNSSEIWLLADARYLIRYDRRRKSWGVPVSVPLAIRGGNSSDNDQSVTTAEEGKSIYVAGHGGLWCYGVKENRWTEKRMPVAIPGRDSTLGINAESAQLTALALSPTSVWTIWNLNNGGPSFAARLDRTTKQWSVYDELKGFPERNIGMRLIAGTKGSGAWLIQNNETYFFDAGRDVWRLAFGRPSERPSQVGEQVPDVAVAQGKAAQSEGMGNVRVADIVIDPKTGDYFVLANRDTYSQNNLQDAAQPSPPSSMVLRCDPNGRIIARSESPSGAAAYTTGYSLLADNGPVLIASSRGVYRAFGAGSGDWTQVAPPSGLSVPTMVTRLYREAQGKGLYVINNDTVAFWEER